MSQTDNANRQQGTAIISAFLVRELLTHGTLTLLTGNALGLIVYWGMLSAAVGMFAHLWIILLTVTTLLRIWHSTISRNKISQHNYTAITREYLLYATAGGTVWASLMIAYDPHQAVIMQLFLLITLVAMPIASLASNGFYLPVFLGFSLPILGSLVIWGAIISPSMNPQFTLMALLYSALVVSIARRYYLTLRKSVERGEENQKLVKDIKEANAKLLHLAYHDPLTDLSNRRQFEENAERLLSEIGSVRTSIALMLVDLDNFKTVNDTLGHEYGDNLLKEISRRIVSSSRQSELILQSQVEAARIGGDEFIIMYHIQGRSEDIEGLAQRVLERLTAPMQLGDGQFNPSVSIGIALAPRHATRIEELLRLADTAMYQAKQEGGGRYKITDPSRPIQ